MHRYQRKLPFVDIIENLGGSASRSQDPARRRRDSDARLRESRGRVRATTASERGGGSACRARAPVTNLDNGSLPPSLPPSPSPDDDVGSVNDYSSVDVDIARHYSFKPSSNRIESGMEMD